MKDYSIFTGEKRTFGMVDYVLLGISVLVSMCIGLYFAVKDRKAKNAAGYLMGNRNLPMIPVAMSLMVTQLSAIGILGVPAEIYNYNTVYWWICGGYIIGMIASTFLFMPVFYRLKILSIYEYLEMRFSKSVRVMASLSFILSSLIYCGIVLYAPSIALTTVTGVNLWGLVLTIITVATLYTALGGMKAVIWTDTFQAVTIIAGLLAILIQGATVSGGFAEAWRKAEDRGRVLYYDFNPDPTTRHTVWCLVIGGGIYWTCMFGLHQAQIQRVTACKSLVVAKRSLIIAYLAFIAIVCLQCMIGIVMFAFYSDCYPVDFMNLVSKSDQILPLFVMDILGKIKGVPGLFISCLVSGSLSSLSSSMNAVPAIIYQDFIKPVYPNLSEKRSVILAKVIVLVYGVCCFAFAYLVSQLGSVLQVTYTLLIVTIAPMYGFFYVGMLFPWVNNKGAIVGCFVSFASISWVAIGSYINKVKSPTSSMSTAGCNWNLTEFNMTSTVAAVNTSDLYNLSYMWYGPFTIVIQITVSLLVSFCTGQYRVPGQPLNRVSDDAKCYL
ncbi:hypothetical protein LOTGIDRAFT_108194 [Lottia gigantea]|uniref:Sodium-coupled monocarboxylate transporter 1 n=1 Tax=Lottia gigantea TaxID=225164 RepID=V3Z0S5_LOTGI|nr:hypothetical protein LOTGIDRAFT_108194 [Lottia gigantea]ESO84103.1 hypothetical protein LOTGIDRAFT_108194 [Lottia gigantea]